MTLIKNLKNILFNSLEADNTVFKWKRYLPQYLYVHKIFILT